jgi:Holliday junction resolvase RusA-like endonuclease
MSSPTTTEPPIFRLPLPPTSNHRLIPAKVGGRTRLITSKEMREWKKKAHELLAWHPEIPCVMGYRIHIYIYWPDRRKRDIDGPVKVCLDALVRAGILVDDSFVRYLTVQDMTTQRQGDDIEPGIDIKVDTEDNFSHPF